MADDEHPRHERAGTVTDALQHLRMALVVIRTHPDDIAARRRLRAIAAEEQLWAPLAALLDEEVAGGVDDPRVEAALLEELAGARVEKVIAAGRYVLAGVRRDGYRGVVIAELAPGTRRISGLRLFAE